MIAAAVPAPATPRRAPETTRNVRWYESVALKRRVWANWKRSPDADTRRTAASLERIRRMVRYRPDGTGMKTPAATALKPFCHGSTPSLRAGGLVNEAQSSSMCFGVDRGDRVGVRRRDSRANARSARRPLHRDRWWRRDRRCTGTHEALQRAASGSQLAD